MLSDHQISLIQFECYEEGSRLLGLANVTLPELNFMTSEVKGAGIAGTHSMPILGQMEDLELKLQWRTLFVSPIKLMKHSVARLSLRGAVETFDAGLGELKVMPLRIDFRGLAKGLNAGKMEAGEQMESESTFSVDWIKITEGDKNTVLEFDRFNFIYSVDGKDFLTEVRGALGL